MRVGVDLPMSWSWNDDRRSTDGRLAHDVLPSPEGEAHRRTDCHSGAESGPEAVAVVRDAAATMCG